jgi:ribosomal protein S18 acetylase RimI-like enzyme
MKIEVREADTGDLDDICRLLTMLFEQEADFEPDYERQLRGVKAILGKPERGVFLVIREAGRVAGTVGLQFLESTALGGRVALLEDLIVHPGNRGRGLGTLLLREAIAYAQGHGCLRITVLTDHDNLPAQALYKRFGFRVSKMSPMRLVF